MFSYFLPLENIGFLSFMTAHRIPLAPPPSPVVSACMQSPLGWSPGLGSYRKPAQPKSAECFQEVKSRTF